MRTRDRYEQRLENERYEQVPGILRAVLIYFPLDHQKEKPGHCCHSFAIKLGYPDRKVMLAK